MITIRDAVLTSTIGWFNGTTIALMAMGPVVITWHFTNAKGMIEKVLRAPPSEDPETVKQEQEIKTDHNSVANMERETCQGGEEHQLPQSANIITERDVRIERELFGLSTVMLRAIAGFISSHAICLGSIIYTLTIRSAVITGKDMPGDMEVFLAIIGPIVTSWSFMRAANTISLLLTGTSAMLSMRKRLAEVISPK